VGGAVARALGAERYCLGTARPENGLAHFFERQMSKNSRFDQMPQDQKDNILEKQVQYGPKFAFAFGVIFTPIFVLFITLVYWGAFNLFNGAALSFKTASALFLTPSFR
jgi:hypothetical protein